MGLFINKKQHPDVFKNKGALIEPNQVEYCINEFTEFVKEQKASNKLIHKSIEGINTTQDKYHTQQKRQWREIEHQFYELSVLHKEHEKIEKQIVEWLKKLENKQANLEDLIKNDQRDKVELKLHVQNLADSQVEVLKELNALVDAKEEIQQKLDFLASLKDDVIGQFETVNVVSEKILNKMDEQTELQQQIADKITTIEETQQEVINRVDGQEGIIDKIVHQIDHVRFVLFERTDYLEEKMEKVYDQVVNYIQKIKNNINQPATIEAGSNENEKREEA